MQLAQLRAGLKTELVDEPVAHVPRGRSSASAWRPARYSASGLAVQVLTQRVLAHEPVEFGDRRTAMPGDDVRLDRALGRLQAQLLEAADLQCRERLVGDVGERGSAPQRQRVACRPIADQSRKAPDVNGVFVDAQRIAAALGDDLRGAAAQPPAQPRCAPAPSWRRSLADPAPTTPPSAGPRSPSG